jgi:hypothetical protein
VSDGVDQSMINEPFKSSLLMCEILFFLSLINAAFESIVVEALGFRHRKSKTSLQLNMWYQMTTECLFVLKTTSRKFMTSIFSNRT